MLYGKTLFLVILSALCGNVTVNGMEIVKKYKSPHDYAGQKVSIPTQKTASKEYRKTPSRTEGQDTLILFNHIAHHNIFYVHVANFLQKEGELRVDVNLRNDEGYTLNQYANVKGNQEITGLTHK